MSSTNRTPGENNNNNNNNSQGPVASNQDNARMDYPGAMERSNNQSHDEGSKVPTAPSGSGKIQFSRPDPGFDPADDHVVKQFHKVAGSTHHVLGPLRQPGLTMKERYLQSLNDLERATGHPPSEQERAFIEKSLCKNTSWLEGYKATVQGQTTVPMAAFNRLAQDYEDTILHVARDRTTYEADCMVSILSRDDQIGALQRELDVIRSQEADQGGKYSESHVEALNAAIAQHRDRCVALEAEVVRINELEGDRCRAVITATESVLRRHYRQRIKALEDQLEENRIRRGPGLNLTSLDALSDEVTELRQDNADLRAALAEYEGPEEEGTSDDSDSSDDSEYDEIPAEEDQEDGTASSGTDVHGENEAAAAPGARGPSQGYLLLKNAFADAQRLRAADKEVGILRARLGRARAGQEGLRANNGHLAPRLNRALRRLAARDSELDCLRAQLAEAENRAARYLAAVNHRSDRPDRPRPTVDKELVRQWKDATERNNRMILTELADEDDMLATFKDDINKMFRDYRNGIPLSQDGEAFTYDQEVPE